MPLDTLDPAVLATTGQAPEAHQVKSVEPHATDPAWSVVTYIDGRTETLPTAQASALPQAPPELPAVTVGAGNPTTPVQPQADEFAGLDGPAPAPTGAAAYPGGQYPEGFSPVAPLVPDGSATPAGPLSYTTGDAYRPAGTPPAGGTLPPGADNTLPPARIDPGATIVPPDPNAPPPGPDERDVTTNQTVADPAALMANTLSTADEQAARLDEQERGKQVAASVQNTAEMQAKAREAGQQWQDAQLARIHTEEAKKAVDIVEATPIETDFFKGSPGRQVAAWVALATSGFLQGATRGANPALNQMMQSLAQAQDRFIENQKQDKASKLNIRVKAFGDARVAEASMRMQLGKVYNDYAMLQAKQFGLDALPPAVSTAGAKMQVDAAQSAQTVGMHVNQVTQEKFKELQAHPEYAAAHELATLLGPNAEKKHAHAMDPTASGLDLPGKIGVADSLQSIKKELGDIAARHGGDLPQQNAISYDTMGVAPLAARMGSKDAEDQVEGRRLLEKLKLMVSSSGSSKLYDSEGDQKRLNKTLDTGTTAETMRAVDEMLDKANRNAVGTAAGVSHNPQGYIDFVRRTLGSNPGVARPAPGAGAGLRSEQVVSPAPAAATTGGGPATPPLPPLTTSPSASAPGTPIAPADNKESPMDLKTLQALSTEANAAGKNGDAITRVVRFEFGNGKPNVSGATGLVQWMPDTFKGMTKPPGYENVTHADLKDLTPEEQVPLAVHYFKSFPELRPDSDVGDYYLAVAAPGALRGHWPDDRVVYPKDTNPKSAWSMNPAWRPKDGGDITVGSIKARARTF